MNAMDLHKIKDRWIEEVYDKADEVDPGEDYIWSNLLLGFLMGAGLPLAESYDIVLGAPENGWPI